MPIGNPISLTNNVATATLVVSATQDQTAFTVTGGYRINKLGVFRNGVRLNASDDFIALDGATVTLIEPCAADDEIVFEVQDDFRVADAIVSAASTQTISGNLVVTGEVYPGTITLTQINASGVITATTFDGDLNGNATTATTAGGLSGTPELSVSTITGVAATFTGNVTIGGTLTYEDVTNIDSVGVITARNGIVVNNNGINVSSGIVTASSFDATDFVSVANSIRHRGDANTTIGFAGNDEIELRTNGLDRLSIKSNGNVVLDNFSSTSGRGKLAFGNSTQWFIESLDANAGGDARFTINEGSDEFLRIDTAGDVGIGTANPLDKLHLFNETSSGLRLETPSGIALLSMVQADGNIANGTIAGDLAIRGQSGISLSPDNGTSVATRITSAGNVGIGETDPTAPLSIKGANVTLGADSTLLSLGADSFGDETHRGIGFGFVTPDTPQPPAYIGYQEKDPSTNTKGDLLFATRDVVSNTAPTERMRITAAGLVGIGTDSPSQILELRTGEPRICLNGSDANSDKGIEFEHNSTRMGHLFHNPTSGEMSLSVGENTGGSHFLVFKTGDGTEKVRIGSDGNTGIRTTNIPHSLCVNGNIQISRDANLRSDASDGGFRIQGGSTFPGGTISLSGGQNTDDIIFSNSGASVNLTERMRIDSDGRLLVGCTTSVTSTTRAVISGGGNVGLLDIVRDITPSDGDGLGTLAFGNEDGDGFAARIEVMRDGGTWTNDSSHPGRIIFSTTPDSSATPTERFRMGSGGQFGVGGANYGSSGQVLTSGGPNAAPSWADAGGGFDAGTVMLFRQTAAPSGWTKDTSNNNGSALRVVTGSVTTGGSDTFGTVFGGSKTTASHTLALSEIPAHTHTINSVTGSGFAGNAITNTNPTAMTGSTGSSGGGGGHSHNLSNMDLMFTDVIQASKD